MYISGLRLDQYKIKSIGQDRVYGEDLSSLTSKTKLGATIRFPEGLENTPFMKDTIPTYIKVRYFSCPCGKISELPTRLFCNMQILCRTPFISPEFLDLAQVSNLW